jgi:hypothetical protein
METHKVSLIVGTSRRILYNIEYSMSKAGWRFPLIACIFFAGILLLFIAASWYSISTTRGPLFGSSTVGNLNYVSFDPNVLVTMMSYWQSSEFSFADKIAYTLITPIVIFGSQDQSTSTLSAAFTLDLSMLVNITSMSILLSLYTNIWILMRKSSQCKIGRVSQGTGMAGGTAGISSVVVSMLLMAGCCGGTGIAFLLFGLPLIGSLLSSIYSNADTYTLLLIAIPAFIVNFVALIYLMSRRLSVSQEREVEGGGGEDKNRKGLRYYVLKSKLKTGGYLFFSAIFLSAFTMGVYWWQTQSNVIQSSGMTGGMQNITIIMFSTLPLSSSLLLVSGLVQIYKSVKRIKHRTKLRINV